MKLENRLEKLNSLKDKIDREIEDVKDKINFSFQKEKTDVAQERLNKWYRIKDCFVKINSITGNSYNALYVTDNFDYLWTGTIISSDYYTDEYKECSEKELKQISYYFERMK